eukprot:127531-Amphidinium_carterae.1
MQGPLGSARFSEQGEGHSAKRLSYFHSSWPTSCLPSHSQQRLAIWSCGSQDCFSAGGKLQ